MRKRKRHIHAVLFLLAILLEAQKVVALDIGITVKLQ